MWDIMKSKYKPEGLVLNLAPPEKHIPSSQLLFSWW